MKRSTQLQSPAYPSSTISNRSTGFLMVLEETYGNQYLGFLADIDLRYMRLKG